MFGVSGIASGLELSAFFMQGRWDWPQRLWVLWEGSHGCQDTPALLFHRCPAEPHPSHPGHWAELLCPGDTQHGWGGWALHSWDRTLQRHSSCIPQLLGHCGHLSVWAAPPCPADPGSQRRRDVAGRAEGWLLSLADLQDGSGCGMGTAQAGPMGPEDGWQPESARLEEGLLWK